ncbi:MAG: hypothetical protein OHK0012_17900 [Synechococcales cyanobacterium]
MGFWRSIGRWLLLVALLVGMGGAVILSEVPRGSLSGSLVLPTGTTEPVRVEVVARGNRVHSTVTQGSTFTLAQLPTGLYDVEIAARGYRRLYQNQVRIEEGQATALPPLTLEYLDPSVNLYGTSRVFTSQETAKVNLSSEGLDQVQLALYPFRVQDFVGSDTLASLADPYGYGFPDSTRLRQQQPLRQWRQGIPASQDDWSTITVDLPKLSAGGYLITAQGTGRTGRTVEAEFAVMVTDLGLIQKYDRQQVQFWAVDLVTRQPVANLPLTVFSGRDPGQVLGRLQTDAQGLARWSFPTAESPPQWLVYGDGGPTRQGLLSGSLWGSEQGYEFLTYTERPLYRPGQTVYFRSIVRQRQPGALLPPPPTLPIRIEARDPKGNPVYEATLSPNRFGTIQGSFAVPTEAELGSYSLSLETDSGDSGYLAFPVEEYRKPEYAVTVSPNKPWVAQGGTVQVLIQGEYLFGGPVANAQVRYRVYRSNDWAFRQDVVPVPPEEAFFAANLAEERYGNYGGFGDLISEGETTTDAGGTALVSLNGLLRDFDWQNRDFFSQAPVQQLRIEVDMTDLSRRSVTGTGRLRVTQGPTALFVDTDRYVATPGETITATVRSYSYDRDPVAVQGQVRLEQWAWDRQQYTYQKVRDVLTVPFQTQQGEGSVSLTLPPDLPVGDYRLVVSSGANQETTFLWVSGSGSWSSGGQGGLRVLADRSVYQVGDTATVVITSPVADAHALVSIEGQQLFAAQVQRLTGQSLTVSVPILPSYTPNVFYRVVLVGANRQVYEGQVQLYVSPLTQFAQVQVSSDHATYRPGDTATITITTRDAQQRPLSAEVSLAVVDEAIYLLRPDPTPDLQRFFYSRRFNRVMTSYSFPQQYPGGLDKLANSIRQDFRDTAAWFPNLVTDAQGQAQVQVTLPDNLTTWRLTAHATSVDTQVGSAVSRLRVTKNLVVRLATPRFFRTSDQLSLTAVVQNQTDQSQTVQVYAETSSHLALSGSPQQSLTIAPQSAVRVEWPAQVIEAGSATVRVIAQGSQDQDAMELTVPVQGFGVPIRQFAQGQGAAQIPLDIPEDVVPGSLHATLRLATTPVGDLLGGLDYLAEFPYGCTEQTLSRFLPALAIADLSQRVGIPLTAPTQQRLPVISRDGLRRLQRLQHGNGGWGWWQWDDSNPYLTAYVLLGYQRAIAAGYDVTVGSREEGLRYLESQLDNSRLSPDTRQFMGYVLSLWQRRAPVIAPEQLSTWGQSYRLLTLIRLGQTTQAQTALAQTLSQINLAQPTWFQAATTPSGDPQVDGQRQHYTEAEVAGSLLSGAAQLGDPRAAQIAAWLLQQRQGAAWETTKATADALLGLSQFFQQQLQQNPPAYRLTVSQGSRLLHEWTPNTGDPYRTLTFGQADVQSGTLTLTPDGPGDLFYTLNWEAVRSPSAASQTQGQSQGQAQGFQVKREYVLIQPQGDRPLSGSVPAGTLVKAKITVITDQPRRYVMVEEPLPSGAEVTSLDQRSWRGDNDYGWNWFWVEQTVRDDRITFFATDLPAGSHEFIYAFRPEIPGTLHVNPTLVEEMYDPQVFGSSSTHTLTVKG